MGRRLSTARAAEFVLVDNFKYGYRNREDVTNLPPGVLIVGSKNVLTNVSERVQLRQGYSLDGATSTVLAPIAASFDWLTGRNAESHLRAGFLTSAGNDGKLQYRYVDSSGNVTWRDLLTGLSSASFNFATFWKTSESERVVLMVSGSPYIQEWNGAVATIDTSTSASITISGTDTWAKMGFYTGTSARAIVVGGSPFTYTGGEGTTTLTGVSPDASGITIGAVAHQQVITTAVSAFTSGPPATFNLDLIANLNNQIFLGSLTSSIVWISNVDSYINYAFSTPRQTGQGWWKSIDGNPVAFNPQESFMYISAGQDLWYNVNFQMQTSTIGVTYEQVNFERLKTGKQQGAMSQAFLSHMKNDLLLADFETTISTFGRVESSLATPQVTNISDPIKLDIDSYDFTDGSIFYYRNYILVAVPKEGLFIQYSLVGKTWDAPMTIPISRFYIVDGELYGHSYNTSESYKLFTGYADRVYTGFLGYPIPAVMTFSYENYKSRHTFKKANMLYAEGYISPNTTITATITRELDGCASTTTETIDGSDTAIVCIPSEQGSLGKTSLGKQKLGGGGTDSIQGLPPKFRCKKTFSNVDFIESSISLSCLGVNQNFQLLAFGLNASQSPQETVSITQ